MHEKIPFLLKIKELPTLLVLQSLTRELFARSFRDLILPISAESLLCPGADIFKDRMFPLDSFGMTSTFAALWLSYDLFMPSGLRIFLELVL